MRYTFGYWMNNFSRMLAESELNIKSKRLSKILCILFPDKMSLQWASIRLEFQLTRIRTLSFDVNQMQFFWYEHQY